MNRRLSTLRASLHWKTSSLLVTCALWAVPVPAAEPAAPAAAAAPAAPTAPAPAPAPAATPAPVTPPPSPSAAPPVAEPAQFSPEQTSAEVLRLYVAEDDAGALSAAQAGLERCDLASRKQCPDPGKALLLRDLGIVQAGAYRDHAAAVATFREALRLDAHVTIPPDLLVERVRLAFEEAGGKAPSTPPPPATPGSSVAAASTPPGEQPETSGSRYDVGDAFLLIVGSWGGGGDSNGTFIGELGGQVSGAWHVAGPLAVGARLGLGVTTSTVMNSTGEFGGPYAVLSAAMLVGLLPRGKRNTGYFLLGVGPDYVPEIERARTTVSLAAGASFGGFTIGGMPAVIFNQGAVGGAMWFLIGWGNYVKD